MVDAESPPEVQDASELADGDPLRPEGKEEELDYELVNLFEFRLPGVCSDGAVGHVDEDHLSEGCDLLGGPVVRYGPVVNSTVELGLRDSRQELPELRFQWVGEVSVVGAVNVGIETEVVVVAVDHA